MTSQKKENDARRADSHSNTYRDWCSCFDKLGVPEIIWSVQLSAILRTALRKVLCLWSAWAAGSGWDITDHTLLEQLWNYTLKKLRNEQDSKPCMTSAIPVQCSNKWHIKPTIPVDCEECNWIYERLYISTAEKDMKTWLIIGVKYTTA